MVNTATSTTTNNSANRNTTVTVDTDFYLKRDKTEGWKGWIRVIQDEKNESIYLSEYTHVKYLKKEKGFVYFLIDDKGCIPQFNDRKEEIPLNNKIARMSEKNFWKFFSKTPPKIENAQVHIKYGEPAPNMFYSSYHGADMFQEWGEMTIAGKKIRVTLNTLPGSTLNSPIPEGRHKILRPVSPASTSTEWYRTQDEKKIYGNDAWFPIEINGQITDRFIHIGYVSHGCVTIAELLKWSEVYDYLISRRKDKINSKYIGEITVQSYARNLRNNPY